MLLPFLALATQRTIYGPPPIAPNSPQPDFLANPKLPIESYKLPPVGGDQEIVMGPKIQSTMFLGYYAQYLQNFKPLGNDSAISANPPYYIADRVGYLDWFVANYPHDGKDAILIQSDSDYKQSLPLMRNRNVNFDNKIKMSYWVSPEGKLLQVNSVISVSAGNWIMSATFGKDSYDLYLKDPVKGERTSTIFPAGGTEVFDAMFKPMLDGKKELLHKKEFYQINPISGAPEKFSARIGGRWDGKYYGKESYHGQYVYLDGPGVKDILYLSDSGQLFRVEEADKHYLDAEQLPESKAHG